MKNFLIWVLVLPAIFVAIFVELQGLLSTVGNKVDEYLRLARTYEEQQRFLEAIAQYRQALDLEPESEKATTALSKLLFKLGRDFEAYDVTRQLLGLRPELSKVRLNLVYILQKQQRWDEAEQEIRIVLEQTKDVRERTYARHLMGRNLLGQKRYKEGEEHLLEVVKVNPNFVEAHLNLAELYSQNWERYEEAIKHFLKVIELRPNLAEARQKLGKVLLNLGRNQEAIDHFERAVQLSPDSPDAYFQLATAYRKAGNLERTQEILLKFQKVDSVKQDQKKKQLKATSYYLEGEESSFRQDLDHALEAFQKAVEIAPDLHQGYFGLAKVYLERKNLGAALMNVKGALELQPYDSRYHHLQAKCLEELNDVDGALAAVRKAVGLDPLKADHHNLLGNLFFRRAEYEKAAAAYRKALEFDSENALYHLNLSSALAKMGHLEESKKEKELYLKLSARNSN